MSSLGLELIKNININENITHSSNNSSIPEKPHVQFKETNEIIEPTESSQIDSTTIINNDNPLFKTQPINEQENITNTINNQNDTQQESNQEESIIISNNKNQYTNKQLIQRNQHINNQIELKPNLKNNTQLINSEQPTNYKKYIPNMHTIIFVIVLIIIVFIIYKYINANAQIFEAKIIEFQEKQKMFKTE